MLSNPRKVFCRISFRAEGFCHTVKIPRETTRELGEEIFTKCLEVFVELHEKLLSNFLEGFRWTPRQRSVKSPEEIVPKSWKHSYELSKYNVLILGEITSMSLRAFLRNLRKFLAQFLQGFCQKSWWVPIKIPEEESVQILEELHERFLKGFYHNF